MSGTTSACIAVYWATYASDIVTLNAMGRHHTSGYQVSLEGTPPEFNLLHEPPVEPVLDVITPFTISASFKSELIEAVIVRDAEGEHRVPVQQEYICAGETIIPMHIEREKD